MQKVMERKTEITEVEVGQTVAPVWNMKKSMNLLAERLDELPIFFNVYKLTVIEKTRHKQRAYDIELLSAEVDTVFDETVIIFSDKDGLRVDKGLDTGLFSLMESQIDNIEYHVDDSGKQDKFTIVIKLLSGSSFTLVGYSELEEL